MSDWNRKNAYQRQTLHVPPPFAQCPQYLQLVQAVQVPFGLQRPARQSEAVENAIAKTRARGFIRMNNCRDACPLSIIFWHNSNEIIFPSVFKLSLSNFAHAKPDFAQG